MDGNGDLILTPELALHNIQKLTQAKVLWVAFSGGRDSHVLLDLLVRALSTEFAQNNFPSGFEVGALHIHHGISHFADAWVQHCESICLQYAVPFKVRYVDGKVRGGKSPEAVAREARFSAFEQFLDQNQALLLAHHAADQAETILLRLFRGSGPLGLGGIREKTKLGKGELIRPLLAVSFDAIVEYAKRRKLNWIEDDSNTNTRFDRDFLRCEVMPLLNARWPHAVRSINRAGDLSFEAAMAGESIAAQDLEAAKGLVADALSVSRLLVLDSIRRRGVIRYWLQRLGHALPSRSHMERIDREVLRAKPGAKPRLKIGLYEIQRYKDELKVSQQTVAVRLNF
jgi:tRNA(Ile)-lysidine synthase